MKIVAPAGSFEKMDAAITPYIVTSGNSFSTTKEYSITDINDIFLRNLRINSRFISVR